MFRQFRFRDHGFSERDRKCETGHLHRERRWKHTCEGRVVQKTRNSISRAETNSAWHAPIRSTTSLKDECAMPYRIDLAGGWLDQPYVGRFAQGPVLTISIEPTVEFNERSGMATSTRRKAIELWHSDIPAGSKERLARILFSYENPPGTKIIAGSQDAIGIVMPGLNRIEYRRRILARSHHIGA